MRWVDEFRDGGRARPIADAIHARATRPWSIMEVCGGQTHAIVRFGIDELLPAGLRLIHGPGCPVCVTPLEVIDRAIAIAARPEVIFCSFGDMLRVPGSHGDLLKTKALGGDVRIVYSPLDALRIAECEPHRQVVFFAVGFETTAPANAMVVDQARTRGLDNFSILASHVLVPPALEAILDAPDRVVDGVLAAGHVSAIMGLEAYTPLATRHRVPIVVTGFEPIDILSGILETVTRLERGEVGVTNAYARAVRESGNPLAQTMIDRVFEVVPRKWRGLGTLERSGLGLRPELARFDAENRFDVGRIETAEPAECKSGLVLAGKIRPPECPAFGTRCTPEMPLGATMVSTEGACAAYYRYRRTSV